MQEMLPYLSSFSRAHQETEKTSIRRDFSGKSDQDRRPGGDRDGSFARCRVKECTVDAMAWKQMVGGVMSYLLVDL